jgi:hypothetical protein
MKSVEAELIRFLSDPKWNDSEFMRLSRLIDGAEAMNCVEAAMQIRESTKTALQQYSRRGFSDEIAPDGSQLSAKRELNEAVYSRLKRLLIGEAGMQQRAAIEALAVELPVPNPSPVALRSLRNAVEYFLQFMDGSTLLSAAQRIRNEFVHATEKHAWRLDDKARPPS